MPGGRLSESLSPVRTVHATRQQCTAVPTNGMTAFYSNSTNPAVAAMRRAARRCFVKDAEKRWSALDIAYEMMDTLDELVEGKEVENIVA